MNIENTWNDPSQLLSVTGLTKAEADELLQDFSDEIQKSTSNRKNVNSEREGRPAKLDNRALFLMLMIYFRHYPTLDIMSFMFEISTSNVKRWLDRCEETIRTVLAKKNFFHLIAQDQEKISRKPLSETGKYILTELSNLYGDRRIK